MPTHLTTPKTITNVTRLVASTLLSDTDVSFLAATHELAQLYHDALIACLQASGVAVSEDGPRRVMALNGAICTFGSFDVRNSDFEHTALVVLLGTRLVADQSSVKEAHLIAGNPHGPCMVLEVN